MPDTTPMPAAEIGVPVPGYYKMALARDGVMVPVHVIERGERDEDGNPIEDIEILVEANGRLVRDDLVPRMIESINLFAETIDKPTYDFMVADIEWVAQFDPSDPKANAYKAVDFASTQPGDEINRANILSGQADALPETLDTPSKAEEAVILAKRMTAVKGVLESSQKAAQAPFKEQAEEAGQPFKDALQTLGTARQRLMTRIHRYLERSNAPEKKIATEVGAKAYARGKKEIAIDEAKLPDEWWTREPNKKAIEKAVKAGEDIPGVTVSETFTTVVA
ncbi:MAG: siphovirus Gp157 family protein [Pikeienuella sp.]